MMADRDILADAKEKFSLAHAAEADNRRNALDDLKFARLAEQWPDNIRREREAEGRPCLTINRLPSFARQIVNDARQNKPSIRVRPADSNADPKTADIYNGLIRNIEVTSNAEVAYDTALESAVYGGVGYFRIRTDYAHDDTFDLDIIIDRVANPFTVYGDPASQAADASDWRFGFVTDIVSRDEFIAKWGKSAEILDWSGDGDEKDRHWRDEDGVRVAEYWDRTEVKRPIVLLSNGLVIDGKLYEQHRAVWDAGGITVVGTRDARGWSIKQHVLTGADVLETQEYAGQYIPIVPVYGDEVNIEGRRYFRGIVRDARDPQQMLNYWRTMATELVALAPKAPWVGPVGSFDSDPRWASAHVKSYPNLEYDPVPGAAPPQRQPFAGVPAGALQEALNASDDMKSVLGMYDASLGARSNETSGRAILARQREGDVATFHYVDNLSRAIRYAGRVLLDLIPHVYDKPRMVRVLGEDGSPRTVPVNGVQGPNGQLIPAEQAREIDPHVQVYELGRGKYDLVVETGPSFTTRREEASTFLLETMRANPATAPLLMDVVAKNQDFPEADVVARRFKAMLPPPIQALEGQGGEAPDAAAMAQQLAQAQQQIQSMQQQLQQAAQAVQGRQAEAEAKARMAEMDLALERQKSAAQLELERATNAQRLQLEREKAQAQRDIEIQKALIAAGAKRDIAQMEARIDAETQIATAMMQPPQVVMEQEPRDGTD